MLEYNRVGDSKGMQYVLTIREKGHSWAGRSPASSVHASREEAEAELRDYVRRNWDAEIGDEPPGDPDEMITAYFSEALEAYKITEGARPVTGNAECQPPKQR